jgi:hypothetical protein
VELRPIGARGKRAEVHPKGRSIVEKRLHLLESFKVRGDDGSLYTVRGYEHLARLDSVPNVDGDWQPTGVSEYKLDTGESVSVDRTGAMSIVGRSVKLHRESLTATA